MERYFGIRKSSYIFLSIFNLKFLVPDVADIYVSGSPSMSDVVEKLGPFLPFDMTSLIIQLNWALISKDAVQIAVNADGEQNIVVKKH